jgi:hypothetical protein
MAWQHQTFRATGLFRACFSPRGARERRAPPEIPGRRTLLSISARLGTGRARVQNPYGSAPCIVVSRTAFPTCLKASKHKLTSCGRMLRASAVALSGAVLLSATPTSSFAPTLPSARSGASAFSRTGTCGLYAPGRPLLVRPLRAVAGTREPYPSLCGPDTSRLIEGGWLLPRCAWQRLKRR